MQKDCCILVANKSILGLALVPSIFEHKASIIVIRLVCMSMLRKGLVCLKCGSVIVLLKVCGKIFGFVAAACDMMMGSVAGVAVAGVAVVPC